jgi:hypothetical protein
LTSDLQNFWSVRPESSATVGAATVRAAAIAAVVEVAPSSIKAVFVRAVSDCAVVSVLDECRQEAHQKEGKTNVAPTSKDGMEEKGEYSCVKIAKLPLGTFRRGSVGAVHGAFGGDVEKRDGERGGGGRRQF